MQAKLKNRLKKLDQSIDEYLEELDKNDEAEGEPKAISKEELEALHKKFEITNNIINDFVSLDFEKVMSKYNE